MDVGMICWLGVAIRWSFLQALCLLGAKVCSHQGVQARVFTVWLGEGAELTRTLPRLWGERCPLGSRSVCVRVPSNTAHTRVNSLLAHQHISTPIRHQTASCRGH